MSRPTFPETFNMADYFLFDRLEEGLGEHTALRFGERTWTYAEVADKTRRMAEVLDDCGLAPEQRVLICLPDVPAFAWSFFGVLHAGGVVAMANPLSPTESLAYLLEYTRACVLITVPEVVERLGTVIDESPWLSAVLVTPWAGTDEDPDGPLDETVLTPGLPDGPMRWHLPEALRSTEGDYEPFPTRRDDIAVWLFTSGSTGQPKAAVHTHRDFAFNTEVYAKRTIGWRRDDVCVSVPKLFFGYATGTNLMFPFAVGGTAALFSERPTAETVCEAVRRYQATILTNVPTMMGKILELDERTSVDLSSLRLCLSAGEALPPALLERWQARFGVDVYDGIGSAEMFHIYISNRPGDVRPGSLGRVVEGYEAKILPRDAEGPGAKPLPPGEVGTLWVKGDSVALCYFGDRDKSWKTFHGHWCMSNDLFRQDEDGYFYFAGRADDLVKVSGQWVSPIEVEDCLLRHPAVLEAAVIGVDRGGLMSTKAFIVLKDGASATAEEIQGFVKERLARYKYPREVEFVGSLPKNDRGKIDRKALKARDASS
ncbi:MAG: benzoate-CoA ligase family protein [Deltaproteobacteria bacterium]|nr:MAG: benzoate-CoA ligase family protein [Deltaproteobacteria bacterium]